MTNHTILVVEDKRSMAEMLKSAIEAEGYTCLTRGSAEDGLEAALGGGVDLVLTDLKLPGMSGLEMLKALKEKRPFTPVIMMTAFGTVETAVEAVKAGAYDFLTKPFDISHMLALVARALETGRMAAENLVLKEEFAESLGFPMIIGESKPLKDVLNMVRKAAPTRATVLITGESGTGKELIARALHHLSPRAKGPFVAINCAAIPRDLLESEFFGHERGAFTGAESRKLGKFELADKGTVFLDEVGEMDMGLQAKLLRVLQGERFERVGGSVAISVDVRVVAASNKDLQRAASVGGFREDLFYRLNVFPIHIPPLRERMEDIPLLVSHFLERFCRELKKNPISISDKGMEALMGQAWKGNVRELENCVERAVILTDGGVITPEHLGICQPCGPPPSTSEVKVEPLQRVAERAVRDAETGVIRAALAASDGNKTKAAEMLDVSYKTLLTKIKEYGVV